MAQSLSTIEPQEPAMVASSGAHGWRQVEGHGAGGIVGHDCVW